VLGSEPQIYFYSGRRTARRGEGSGAGTIDLPNAFYGFAIGCLAPETAIFKHHLLAVA
jgi:hypothetical protein